MIIESPLESQRFSIKAGKLQLSPGIDLHGSIQHARKQGYDFLSCRVRTSDVDLVQDLTREGFFLTDTLVYYRRSLESLAPVREWISCRGEAFVADVLAVAQKAFQDYPSHYAMDKRLDRERVAEVYQDWAMRSCGDLSVATEILGSFENGRLIAFVSVKDHLTHGEVLLAAVHPDFQGQGVLQKLLQASSAWAYNQGHKEIFYSTQLQNVAAQKALARQGWEMSHSFYTLHCWLD